MVIVTLWGHCGTKDIIVALLGSMVPRGRCEAAGLLWNQEAIAAFHGLVQPKGHGDAAGHCGSMETIVALQGPMESWRPL